MEHHNKVTKTAHMANEILPLSTIPSGKQSGTYLFHNDITEKVFGNDMLLEEILTYAIHINKYNVDLQALTNVRSVTKSWRSTTGRILKKVWEPVIKLTLTKNHIHNKKMKIDQGKPLDRFIQTFTTSKVIAPSAIPFKLKLTENFFWEENYNSLLECLTRLGSSLFELEISYPKDGGTLPVDFPNLSLPSLKKIVFYFSDFKVKQNEHDDEVKFGNNIRGTLLIQSILNGTENLKELVYSFGNRSSVPKDFKFLWFPPTIWALGWGLNLERRDYEILLRNNLPSLERLTLFVHEFSSEDDLMYKILERVQDNLKYLKISRLASTENLGPSTHFRFPIMRRLERISITSEQCDLGPGEVFNLHECLPKLKFVTLDRQKVNNFKKWIEKSKFENVGKLEVSFINEYVEHDNDERYISADTELIQGMYKAFPNIIYLSLTFNVTDLTGLSCIFQNMTNLNHLIIELKGNLDDFSSDLFDSKVLCVPLQRAKSLRENRDNLETVEFKSITSIRNLTELTRLSLWTTHLEDVKYSLLSEVLVNYGLLQMPKLRFLSLQGKFKPTPEITKLWEDSGRLMMYNGKK